MVESYYPQYPVLLSLLGLTPLKTPLTSQNFSLEKVILSQPNVLISLTDKQGYNATSRIAATPYVARFFQKPTACQHPDEIYLLFRSWRVARGGEDLSTVKIM